MLPGHGAIFNIAVGIAAIISGILILILATSALIQIFVGLIAAVVILIGVFFTLLGLKGYK